MIVVGTDPNDENPLFEATDPRVDGSNIDQLLRWGDDYDPHHGQPRMSAVPVSVTKR